MAASEALAPCDSTFFVFGTQSPSVSGKPERSADIVLVANACSLATAEGWRTWIKAGCELTDPLLFIRPTCFV